MNEIDAKELLALLLEKLNLIEQKVDALLMALTVQDEEEPQPEDLSGNPLPADREPTDTL